jgi:hypothetical protein
MTKAQAKKTALRLAGRLLRESLAAGLDMFQAVDTCETDEDCKRLEDALIEIADRLEERGES